MGLILLQRGSNGSRGAEPPSPLTLTTGGGPASPYFGDPQMRALCRKNNNQIMRGDLTRCEENLYGVDHEC